MATSVRLTPELSDRLENLVTKTGRTKAFYLRQIIEDGLTDIEDYYLGISIRDRVLSGQEKVHSADSVRKDLGLDD
jgi:RHH-type rel operon transcriptional repressor/antitoxin RelB